MVKTNMTSNKTSINHNADYSRNSNSQITQMLQGKKVGVLSHGSCDSYLLESVVGGENIVRKDIALGDASNV